MQRPILFLSYSLDRMSRTKSSANGYSLIQDILLDFFSVGEVRLLTWSKVVSRACRLLHKELQTRLVFFDNFIQRWSLAQRWSHPNATRRTTHRRKNSFLCQNQHLSFLSRQALFPKVAPPKGRINQSSIWQMKVIAI